MRSVTECDINKSHQLRTGKEKLNSKYLMGFKNMGNSESAENQGVGGPGKQTDEGEKHKLYRFVDMHGGGELVPWMRYAKNSGDYSIIDEFIETKVVKEFMYNSGKGKMVSVAELVKIRNKERNAMLSALKRKKGKGKSGPNILDDFNQEGQNQGDLKKALKLLDGGGKGGKGDSKYREVAWKLDERGTMGENLVGICLLHGTAVHNQLAIKLMLTYPKMVNDIFISEDYYGLSPLHQAIVNEDPAMVNFLLQHGADINQRCYGASFCPDDQKSSRTDSLEHEYVELSQKTSYDGRMYFGEYPLSFAACTNQLDCYRLLRSKRADPNQKDTNGNTVLHLTVIHEKPEMLKLAYNTGAKLQVMNNQNLTPLTLAAHLAKKEMFEQILKLESDVVWMYGDASSHAYPLAKIDTINQETGYLNEDSALSLIVYGETTKHLDLLDGLLEDLLQAKWEAFGRRRLAISFSAFLFYYTFVFMAFMCRPFSMTTQVITDNYIDGSDTSIVCNQTNPYPCFKVTETILDHTIRYLTTTSPFATLSKENEGFNALHDIDFLQVITDNYIDGSDTSIVCNQTNPYPCFKSKRGCPLIIANCGGTSAEGGSNIALKFIGPFVLMIYTILSRDLSRFLLIYAIFLIGFSQAFYLIFLSCARAKAEMDGTPISQVNNILDNPAESIMRMFIMTIGEFTVFYRELNGCKQELMRNIGKRESLSQTEKELREQQERDIRQEKRTLLKRRLKEMANLANNMDLLGGKMRPLTSYLNAPPTRDGKKRN
uniref:ANK_REP_REGION domain-containing protein n=1 Tax=Parascaris univalens TaxID=6257 RepID=A0A915BMB3_PARUN